MEGCGPVTPPIPDVPARRINDPSLNDPAYAAKEQARIAFAQWGIQVLIGIVTLHLSIDKRLGKVLHEHGGRNTPRSALLDFANRIGSMTRR